MLIPKLENDLEKDYKFIYHVKIPERSALQILGNAPVAKITAYSWQFSTSLTRKLSSVTRVPQGVKCQISNER